ncbi:MAG: glycosyltransferase [Desulfurococcales archaeon]|nr:glycosyltransferase [Desulfurococcales archaeon]
MEARLRIALVSPYAPPYRTHAYGSGVGSYTKNLAEALKTVNPGAEVFVIADRLPKVSRVYRENGVFVIRSFSRRASYVFQVFRELCRIRPVAAHIQHEHFLYGGLLASALSPLLVLLSRLVVQRVITTMHHGVFPLRALDDEGFRRENGLRGPPFILRLGLLLVTRLLASFSDRVIVHEAFMKKHLATDYRVPPGKIEVVPHGVEKARPLPMDEAKRRLGLRDRRVILYFGYLSGYKGIKELLEAYRILSKRVSETVLVIAGGPHPRLARSRWYRSWLRRILGMALRVRREVSDRGGLVLAGYLPEEKIRLYFSASDVVVLPYRARIGASGPEALAIAFERCYVKKYLDDRYSPAELSMLVERVLSNPKRCRERSTRLKSLLSWDNMARLHLKVYLDGVEEALPP